jgi:hypothetical protein
MRQLLCAALALAAACGEPSEASSDDAGAAGALLNHAAWQAVSAEEDAFAAHRPALVYCPNGTYFEEDGALEVQTGYCNYFALAQPLPDGIAAGDTLHVVLWHERLVAEPAQGHAAILLGNEVAWERVFRIPSDPAVYDETFVAIRAYAKGEALGFHLHNHGYNTWALLTLEKIDER